MLFGFVFCGLVGTCIKGGYSIAELRQNLQLVFVCSVACVPPAGITFFKFEFRYL